MAEFQDVGELTRQVAAEVHVQRAALDWTRQDLAERVGIPDDVLAQIENGSGVIDLDLLGKFAHVFALDVPDFIATAIRNSEQRLRDNNIYLPDGRLDPVQTMFAPPSDEHIAELREMFEQRKKQQEE